MNPIREGPVSEEEAHMQQLLTPYGLLSLCHSPIFPLIIY